MIWLLERVSNLTSDESSLPLFIGLEGGDISGIEEMMGVVAEEKVETAACNTATSDFLCSISWVLATRSLYPARKSYAVRRDFSS